MNTIEKNVTSKDGTTIAFEQSGTGSAIVLVGAALTDRADTTKLARLLAQKFTVINYDRRGRGQSSDTQPYAAEREVEDLGALIEAAGGSAYLFGSSSGAVLALEAAGKLGNKVTGLFMYEPPFIIDDSHPPVPADLAEQIGRLVPAGRRSDAVKLFFTKGMGIPAVFVTLMRLLMPGWSKMAGVAHTIPYDLAVLAGTQTGQSLPAGRWASAQAPALVMVGGKSETFFHTGAKALAGLLPNAQYRSLAGGNHGSVVMAPKAIAAAVSEFFKTQTFERQVA
ncbi:MAG: alpha/beta hydrolase [Chloroflexi bacterium]|nr:alpha/beta hydrolase [Chloroflexota bacterium]MCI0647314.1 alpha/beta hydrolase [Chloroflexota bacterium]MCI0730566.1 alpha/beta hydrolase [Chloroflexota bacterium]